jgi:hypothetical protein
MAWEREIYIAANSHRGDQIATVGRGREGEVTGAESRPSTHSGARPLWNLFMCILRGELAEGDLAVPKWSRMPGPR